jgi:hypothetical protein
VRRDIQDGNESALYSDLNNASKNHQINNVLTQLSPSELTSLDRLIDQPLQPSNSGPPTPDPQPGPPPPGFPLPGQDARNALFKSMAQGGASAANLAKLTKSLNNGGDAAGVAAAVSSRSSDFKLDYIKGLTPETFPPGFIGPIPRGATRAPAGQTALDPNSAVAVGNVLANLKGDPAAVNQAFNDLTDKQLNAVMQAGINSGSDTVGLSAIINAAATDTHDGTKARVFTLAAQANGPNNAGQAVGALTNLLETDPQGIINDVQLRDESGVALTAYAQAALGQGSAPTWKDKSGQDLTGSQVLGLLLSQLRLGSPPNQNHLTTSTGTDSIGQKFYGNAYNLGYFVGAVVKADQNRSNDANANAQTLNTIVSGAFSALQAIPYAQVGAAAGGTAVQLWINHLATTQVNSDTSYQEQFYQMAMWSAQPNAAGHVISGKPWSDFSEGYSNVTGTQTIS